MLYARCRVQHLLLWLGMTDFVTCFPSARTLLMLKQNETPGNDVTLQPVDVRPPRIYLPTIIEVYRATQLLSPQYLPLCSPFIFCALVGPGTVHVPDDRVPIESQSASLYAETIRLVLSNVARHWSIGGVLLGKLLSTTVLCDPGTEGYRDVRRHRLQEVQQTG